MLRKLKNKAVKRILAAVIAALLGYLGFSGELAKMIGEEGAEIVVEQVSE
jgi:hypothetical protein